jgi:hypothetical protein
MLALSEDITGIYLEPVQYSSRLDILLGLTLPINTFLASIKASIYRQCLSSVYLSILTHTQIDTNQISYLPVYLYTVKYSETCLCWPPLVPLKAAELIQVANLRKPTDTMKM